MDRSMNIHNTSSSAFVRLFLIYVCQFLLIPVMGFAEQVSGSYTVNLPIAVGSYGVYHVDITGAPANAIITSVEAKFDYIAYGVVQNYVSVRFNRASDPGPSGGASMVAQGSLPAGNPGTYGYVSFSNWNGQAANASYYFRYAVAAGSPYTSTLNTLYVRVTYNVPSLTVTSPNGGESWQAGTTHNITWNSAYVTGTIQIQPYSNGVAQANITGSAPNTGSYSWSIPTNYPPGSTYKMSLSAMSGTVWDLSDGNFTITAPSTLTVTSPNGGESWQAGTTHNITCNSAYVTGTIQIQPYLNGVAQVNINRTAPNTGSYSWNIPSHYPPGSTYKIALSAMSGTVSDFSDGDFSITARAEFTIANPT